jgi:hypothetical protein
MAARRDAGSETLEVGHFVLGDAEFFAVNTAGNEQAVDADGLEGSWLRTGSWEQPPGLAVGFSETGECGPSPVKR